MLTDAELLHRFVEKRAQDAFAELVRRHLNLVYSAAFRRTNGRHDLTEDIAQKVFTDLARKAGQLTNHPTLTGWLYRSTRYAAIDVMRIEQRRGKLAQILTTMPEEMNPADAPADWAQLRPVIDEAMDQLKEQDREIMLLRFFQGLTFAEVGAKLELTENAARMRTERALDKLRLYLAKRGITSTATLAGLLASQSLVAAPAGLAATVATTALAAAPAVGAGLFTTILMSKITLPVFSAALAAGATALVWTSLVPTVNAEELAALRVENAKLAQATATNAPAESVAAVANDYAAQATAIAQAMTERQAAKKTATTATTAADPSAAVTPRGHSNHGNTTAHDAAMSFAWAGDISDPDELGKLVYFDSDAREKALAIWGTMPEAIRVQYPTPEAFYGLLLAAATMEGPPPGADVMERSMEIVELKPGRAALRKKGSEKNFHEYQLTDGGWKHVLSLGGVKGLPSILNSQTLAKLVKH